MVEITQYALKGQKLLAQGVLLLGTFGLSARFNRTVLTISVFSCITCVCFFKINATFTTLILNSLIMR